MAQYDVSEIAIGSDSYVLKDATTREVKVDQSDIAIIIDGNKTTHTGGAAAGEFVLVRNSTISGITDGLYTATQEISANTAIDSTYLTAVDGGGLNAISDHIASPNNLAKKIYGTGDVQLFGVLLSSSKALFPLPLGAKASSIISSGIVDVFDIGAFPASVSLAGGWLVVATGSFIKDAGYPVGIIVSVNWQD